MQRTLVSHRRLAPCSRVSRWCVPLLLLSLSGCARGALAVGGGDGGVVFEDAVHRTVSGDQVAFAQVGAAFSQIGTGGSVAEEVCGG